jgi:hypothetical protein
MGKCPCLQEGWKSARHCNEYRWSINVSDSQSGFRAYRRAIEKIGIRIIICLQARDIDADEGS